MRHVAITAKTAKHAHAAFAWEAMTRHPWRTEIMSEAQLAVIPIPFDAMAIGLCNMEFPEMVLDMMSILNRSSLFPRVRHLVIANHWMTKRYLGAINSSLWPSGILAGMDVFVCLHVWAFVCVCVFICVCVCARASARARETVNAARARERDRKCRSSILVIQRRLLAIDRHGGTWTMHNKLGVHFQLCCSEHCAYEPATTCAQATVLCQYDWPGGRKKGI